MQGHTFLLYHWDYVTNTKGKYSVCNKHIIMQGHTFLLYRWDYVTNTKGKYSVCNKHIIMQGHTFLLYHWDYVTNTKGKYSVCNKHIIMQGHTFLLYRWDYVTNTKGKYSVCNKHIIMQGHTFLLYHWDYVTNTKGKYSVCNKHITSIITVIHLFKELNKNKIQNLKNSRTYSSEIESPRYRTSEEINHILQRGEVWAHGTSLTHPLLIKVFVPTQLRESEQLCICVLGYRFSSCFYDSSIRFGNYSGGVVFFFIAITCKPTLCHFVIF